MEFFDPIRARLPFPLMQEHCSINNLPTAQGWDKLLVKLEEEIQISAARSAQIDQALATIFRETISVGTRAVKVFRLPPDEAPLIAARLAEFAPEDSPFMATYPRPIDSNELAVMPAGVFLCDVGRPEQDGSTTLVFCGRRILEEREARTRAQLGDAAVNQFGWGQYDEFVFVRRRYVQSFEIVRVDVTRALLELRVEDHSGVDSGSALEQLQVKVNGLLAPHFGMQLQLVNPINLFPAIKALYDDQAAGIVVELGFTTDTGSSKHEKMRSSRADLRLEQFHVGGKAAVNGILTPFRVAVRWAEEGQRTQEEVLLPGSIRMLGSAHPYLDHMVLSGALTEAKMQATLQRVVDHLPAPE
ncbi:hypothetical protein [Roseateles aquatilis]|uniref:hypothetical protein n=1 Tax=Roseateles aquatilis TaxID=431061 RepID=UPI00113039D3|nr:hypothetical protein [Roseateles aquatilis]